MGPSGIMGSCGANNKEWENEKANKRKINYKNKNETKNISLIFLVSKRELIRVGREEEKRRRGRRRRSFVRNFVRKVWNSMELWFCME